eukprot:11121342-Heterocapsa_arctica.AAC.1
MHKPVETGGKRTPSTKNGRLALKHVILMLLYNRILDVKRVLRAHTARFNFVLTRSDPRCEPRQVGRNVKLNFVLTRSDLR